MLNLIKDLPENVLGVSAEGKVSGKDYETILIPAVEKKLKTHNKMRLLYYIGDKFTGFDATAILDDAKIGVKHWSSWEKIAVVSDNKTLDVLVKFFSHILSCEVCIFKDRELEMAKKWISEK